MNKYIHRYQLSWETKITDLKVTEYRYPPFDRGERIAKQKLHQKETQKHCEEKNQSLYTRSPNLMELFSTEKLSK